MERKLRRAAQSTTKADLKRIKKGNRLKHRPWTPPTALKPETLNDLDSEPRTSLSCAVDMMAFGGKRVPKSALESAARRLQASRALCDAARTNLVTFIGNPDRRGDKSDPIPAAYFDMPRCLGSGDNTLVTDLDRIKTMDDFVAARNKEHQIWFNVRIETKSFHDWIRRALGTPIEPVIVPKPSKLATSLQAQIRQVAARLFPGNNWSRVSERDKAIRAEFATPPHERTIRRALGKRP